MTIHILNKTGLLHDTHTEDHVVVQELGEEWIIGAVMDGCSSGKESYFASALFGKIIRKSIKGLSSSSKLNPIHSLTKLDSNQVGEFILSQIFEDLGKAHKLFETELVEMLTTLLLLVYFKRDKSAWINISGDGIIVHDHQIIEIDQNNVPDYMAYHLDISFEEWLGNFSRTYNFNNLTDLSISTDGISKFITQSQKRPQTIDPVHYLLIDESFHESANMLEEKYKVLKEEYGLIPYDDLGMIRIFS
jgi:hypothetical protein